MKKNMSKSELAAECVWNFVSTDPNRTLLNKPYHDKENGVVVATDSKRMIVTKYGYNPNAEAPDGVYPRWGQVIPKDIASATPFAVAVDAAKLRAVCKAAIPLAKALGYASGRVGPCGVAVWFKPAGDGDLACMDGRLLLDTLEAMECNGIGELRFGEKGGPVFAFNESTTVVQMPLRLEKEDRENLWINGEAATVETPSQAAQRKAEAEAERAELEAIRAHVAELQEGLPVCEKCKARPVLRFHESDRTFAVECEVCAHWTHWHDTPEAAIEEWKAWNAENAPMIEPEVEAAPADSVAPVAVEDAPAPAPVSPAVAAAAVACGPVTAACVAIQEERAAEVESEEGKGEAAPAETAPAPIAEGEYFVEYRPEDAARLGKTIYAFHSDGGHGWLAVPASMLAELGIAADVSRYSYADAARGLVFLEEDCDAGVFLKAHKAQTGERAIVYNVHDGDYSAIRNLPRYDAPAAPAQPRPVPVVDSGDLSTRETLENIEHMLSKVIEGTHSAPSVALEFIQDDLRKVRATLEKLEVVRDWGMADDAVEAVRAMTA